MLPIADLSYLPIKFARISISDALLFGGFFNASYIATEVTHCMPFIIAQVFSFNFRS